MAPIVIRDGLGAEIISANPQVTSGFGKYLKGTPAGLLAGVDSVSQLRTPVHLANAGEGGLGLSWSGDVSLGQGKAALTISAGARAVVGVYNRTGMLLLENTFIGAPLKVPAGQGFVAFSLRPTLELGLKQQVGALSFGFSAGSEADLRYYEAFDLTGPPIPLAAACKQVLERFVIPNSADDLKAMKNLPAGALAVASGHGTLAIGATINLVAAFNPLASVNALPKLGPLQVTGAASATVEVNAALFGDFQIRAQKMDGSLVRLSYHKVAGRSLDVAIAASAGPGVGLGHKDLLGLLFKGPGGMPGAARQDLVEAGISSKQLDSVAKELKAGMSRKLEVALQAEFSTLRQDEAAFLYEIDLDRLDDTGASALDRALAGDLSALNALEPDLPAHGLRVLQSRTDVIRKKNVSWRINLVGLINVLSMSELVRTGVVVHDEESGEVVITDKVSSERIGAITDRKSIRRLLYESTVMTLTYKASGLDVNAGLEASQSFFFFDKSANRQRVSDYLDAVAAVGLMDAGDIDGLLDGHDDFGKAGLSLDAAFNQTACERVFRQPGEPPDQAFYEAIGRRALLALVKSSDPDSYRRVPMRDDALWAAMKDAGQPSFHSILPPPITSGDEGGRALRVAVVAADYSLIVWWAEAMATAAERLAKVRSFLKGKSIATLGGNPQFQKLQGDLEEAVVKAIRKNRASFDDPWGLVALSMAAEGTAQTSAMIQSAVLTLVLPAA